MPALAPRYNIAPTQEVLTITGSKGDADLGLMTWGLIPSWSSEPTGFINARAETLESKRSFRDSFERRRCLVPADGFYEWRRNGKSKQPFYFQLTNEMPFAFAAIWDEWRDFKADARSGASIKSCSIVTTRPNELLATIHDRMPVILPVEAYDVWLNENSRLEELKEWLLPFPADEMKSFPVSQRVNQAKVEDAELVEPVVVEEAAQGLLF